MKKIKEVPTILIFAAAGFAIGWYFMEFLFWIFG